MKSENLIRSCCEDISFLDDINECLPKDDDIYNSSQVLKAISDPVRLKILLALLKYEICVGEMAKIVKLPQSHVSNQLKILRAKNIVTFKKEKKMSFYSICNEEVKVLLELLLKDMKV